MTDEQIIKALECCSRLGCSDEETAGCPLKPCDSCITKLSVNALDLINRQKAEISVLRKLLDKAETEMNNQSENLKKLVAGHRSLQKDFESANEELFFRRLENCELADKIEKAEAEAIKEFAESLHEKLYTIPTVYNSHFGRMVDNLVKEMVGDTE